MDFELAEQNYIRLEKLRRSGQISEEEYRTSVQAIRVLDDRNRWWMVQEQTGQWYVWGGGAWYPEARPGGAGVIRVSAPAPSAAPAAPASQPAPAAQPPPQPAYTAPPVATGYTQAQQPAVAYPQGYAQAQTAQPGYPQSYGQPVPYPQGYPQPYAQPGVGQAGMAGYVTQPVVPPNLALARKRPGCFSVTLSMLLWALVWGVAAYAAHSLLRITPWWAYLGVGLGALATLILWVRLITRHGRALRRLQQGGAA
jgi:hypothetical protein